ncbi:MAG: tRNA 2-selenouridine synthase [Saprospiraceae bacterium]|jgi:tRNA 2-selenouridine synthase
MKIKVFQIWSDPDSVLFDVRTPSEFRQGHIPGAHNFPLFSDEERAIVGTLYKQQGKEEAMIKGLEFVGPKMSKFVKKAKKLAAGKKIVIHCWRGGKRSESMGWLLGLAGNEVSIIEGGYKAYRNYFKEQLEKLPLKIIVLGGRTGCGKTIILKALAEKGEQVIDLEGLACHKGSAFGALGESEQPTTEQFENDLYAVFRQLDPGSPIWVENENRSTGKVFIPEGFWKQMKAAPVINLERPFEQRKEIILEQYGQFSILQLKDSFIKIQKRLGGQNLNAALEALDQNDLPGAIAIALHYYDKAYQYYLDNNQAPKIHQMVIKNEGVEEIADKLIVLGTELSSSKNMESES